jgi:hypothetical protein
VVISRQKEQVDSMSSFLKEIFEILDEEKIF